LDRILGYARKTQKFTLMKPVLKRAVARDLEQTRRELDQACISVKEAAARSDENSNERVTTPPMPKSCWHNSKSWQCCTLLIGTASRGTLARLLVRRRLKPATHRSWASADLGRDRAGSTTLIRCPISPTRGAEADILKPPLRVPVPVILSRSLKLDWGGSMFLGT
jgi:hypothetical protein